MTARLLFIDDEPADAQLANLALRRAGIRCEYRVLCSESSLVEGLNEDAPHLILCDIVLPGWDCWAARRVCRRLAPVTPFVLHSGVVSIEDRRLAQQRGAFGWAEKDSPQQLIDIVTLALKVL